MVRPPGIYVDEEIFLGRVDEQNRFREALRALRRDVKQFAWMARIKEWIIRRESAKPPFVFLLYGEGGMGKSTLARRLRGMVREEPEFKGHFRTIWLDWEQRRSLDNRLLTRDSVSPETVFEHLYHRFRDEGLGDKFEAYEQTLKDRARTEEKVEQALSSQSADGEDRYAPLRALGGAGLTWLVRTYVPSLAVLPEEPTAKAMEALMGGGAEALARAHQAATDFLRAKLNPDERDLFTLPHEMLARRLADGIRDVAAALPTVVVLDTYEIVDRADIWLRVVMTHAGPRVLWIVAGRDNLADSRKFGHQFFTGYRAEFPSDRLRVFSLGEFSADDVAAYFAAHVRERPLQVVEAQAIHRATLGIPLAIQEAAAIWKAGAALDEIVSDISPRAPRERIVKVMTERFLLHCFNDPDHPDDLSRLYALAMVHRPDTDLLAKLLQSENLEHDLSELERRHSFVFVSSMTLHDAVTAFLREYLLEDVRRKSKEVRDFHEHAVAYLQEQRQPREAAAPTLEARLTDEHWTATMLDLVHHTFWLDEERGWAALMPALIGGLAYDSDFVAALVAIAAPFISTFTQAGKRRLTRWQRGLMALDVDEAADLLAELEASAHMWPDDGCASERRAIIDWQHGQLLSRRAQYNAALAIYEQTEQSLPEGRNRLKQRLAMAFNEVGLKLGWERGRPLPSEEALTAYQKAIELDPKYAYPWNNLGNVYRDQKRLEEAITAFQKAIELDPKYAYPWNNLGNVYRDQKRLEEAITAYQKALEVDPKYAYAWNNLRAVYREQGRLEEAVVAQQKAVELDPKLHMPELSL